MPGYRPGTRSVSRPPPVSFAARCRGPTRLFPPEDLAWMRARAVAELTRSRVRARPGRSAPRKRRRANHRFKARKDTEPASTALLHTVIIHRLKPRPGQTT